MNKKLTKIFLFQRRQTGKTYFSNMKDFNFQNTEQNIALSLFIIILFIWLIDEKLLSSF